MIATASFAEGEFHRAEEWETESEAYAFALGFSEGAGAYGAGSAAVYVLPKDAKDMHREQSKDEIARVTRAIAALVEEQEEDDEEEGDAS
jgi:hypothetical protein